MAPRSPFFIVFDHHRRCRYASVCTWQRIFPSLISGLVSGMVGLEHSSGFGGLLVLSVDALSYGRSFRDSVALVEITETRCCFSGDYGDKGESRIFGIPMFVVAGNLLEQLNL
ncbi:hypothetical protein F2Q68_00010874 [Brassica cretica]|uniref:Uncharacterized protein n=1 Tax=Brassica cretica TaxID=69181 RepID=A0A8S9KRK9_BRACR|nr:hypothetical protein F2Q68_00010874 [Brassica cretica]